MVVSIDNTDVNVAHGTGTVTFDFSEAPAAFTLADINTVGGTLSNLNQVTARTYTATFTASPDTDIANASVSVTTTSSVKFSSAVATFYEIPNNWAPSQMIDGIFTGPPPGPGQDPTFGGVNGWSIAGTPDGADALLTLANPLPAGQYYLTFRIYQNYYGNPGHILGDFALEYTTAASPILSSPQTPVSIQNASSLNGTTFSLLSPGELLADTSHNAVGTDTYTVSASIDSATPITGVFLDAIKNSALPGGGPGGQYGNGNFVVSEFTLDASAAASTAPFTIDTVVPTDVVSIDNTLVNVVNDTGVVTFAFSEAPAAFTLADTSAVGGILSNLQHVNATTYTATFTGATDTAITDASVSVSPSSYHDSAGNAGEGGSTAPFMVETRLPTIVIDPVAGDDVVNAAEAQQPLVITGTSTGVAGRTVTVRLTSDSFTGTIGSDGTWSVTIPDPQSSLHSTGLADGSYTIWADVTDQYGNQGETTRTLNVHETPPTIAIDAITGDDVLTTAEGRQPLAITGASTGVVGQTVTVGLNGAQYTGTVASDGTWSVTVPQSALLTSVLSDGSYAVTADVSDQYGNPAQEATRSLTVQHAIVINSITDLENINNDLSGNYVLGQDIDATATATWNNGAGFIPIGDFQHPFTGTLDGKGHVIRNLVINNNDPTAQGIGLFGYVGQGGVVGNVGLVGGSVTGTGIVGALVGVNRAGSIIQSYSDGMTVTGDSAGGLVGLNYDLITNSYSNAVVIGTSAGGLVAANASLFMNEANPETYGIIQYSHASGTVTGTGNAGGLAGSNGGGWISGPSYYETGGSHDPGSAVIDHSYSTAEVFVTAGPDGSGTTGGGLVGGNAGIVEQSFSTGAVTEQPFDFYPVNKLIGGLVGSDWSGTIIQSYATGPVSAHDSGLLVGSLIGAADSGPVSTIITQSYAIGPITAVGTPGYPPYTGGLVGYQYYNPTAATNAYWNTDTTGQTSSAGGTGLTTAQFMAGLPSGFDSTVWGTNPSINNGYPYLLANPLPPLPVLTVHNIPGAVRGQAIALTTLLTISDPGNVGYNQLELWDSNGTPSGGQFVVNGAPQSGGREIDISPTDIVNAVFDVGLLGGTDTIWARLLQSNAQLTDWQKFLVAAPIDTPPTVTPNSFNLMAGHRQSFAASSLFTAIDPEGDTITQYDFWNGGAGGGHFALNAQVLGANEDNYVTAAQLAQTVYEGGSGSDTLWVRAYDGALWSPWSQSFTVTAPIDTGPLVTPVTGNLPAVHNQSFAASSLFHYSDPFGDLATEYDFWNSGSGGGHFVLNGTPLGGGQDNYISPAQLTQLSYQSGSGADTLWVRVTDGTEWSPWSQAFTVTAPIDTGPVVTSSSLNASRNQRFAASSLFNYSDPFGDPATQYDFWSLGTGGGHFELNGTVLGSSQDNFLSAAQLPDLTYQSGSGADTLWVRAFDGAQWSAWSSAFTVTAPVDTGPVVTSVSANLFATHNESFAVAGLFASFSGLGFLPGYDYGEAVGVSNDGSVVAGNVRPIGSESNGSSQAFKWTAATGVVGLGFAAGDNMSRALGISGNGAVVVGYSQLLNSGSGGHAFSWSSATGVVGLGDVTGGNNNNTATAANVDGSVVVGGASVSFSFQATRWAAPTGMVTIGNPPGSNFSRALSTNGDGSVVVGYGVVGAGSNNTSSQAFRWTASTGSVGLDLLPGALGSIAYGVNADGSVVVGLDMRYGDINDEAFRWTASTESIGLGFLPGDNFSQANAVDADGSVVVGESGGKGIYHAFIWTPATGMLSLQDLLVADGVNVVGWSDLIATGVSADGKVIVGNGVDPLGYNEAWIANLPLSGTALFGVSDPFNDPIKQYDFWDSGSGGGHFVLNGVALGANQDNYVSAAQLPQVTYQSGSGPDTMWVRVTDGNEWSAWSQSFTITAPTDTGPIVTSISNINTIAGQTFAASSLFTASDPFNDPIQQCEFWDTGSGGGRFLLNGQPLGTNQDNYILGAQLQQTSYIAGSGTDTLWVRVSEGGQWSPWSPSFTVSDPTTIGADETLELSSAYSGQLSFVADTGTLKLDSSASFEGTVAGMSGQDTIDFTDIDPTKVQKPNYAGDASGGTLTVTDGLHSANIALLGNYLASTFVTSSDGHGKTNVVEHVASTDQTAILAQPQH